MYPFNYLVNFCISGNAVLWYYREQSNPGVDGHGIFYPLKLLVCKHIGSVIAASFLTGFFSIFDFIFDMIKPSSTQNSCYLKCYSMCCACYVKIFDFVRSDTLAYIFLSGNAFCNSARYCEYLCEELVVTSYSQSCSRIYRLCSHFLLVGILTIISLYSKGNISIYAILLIILESLIISTLFISYHADAAEALQIIYLQDQEFINRKEEGRKF